jgi:condensin-2 complex subunit G2
VLDAYGEIVYRAWGSATGACALEVSQSLIQPLAEAALLASTPAMAAALRRVLRGLHAHKASAGVDAMLCEQYGPILYRRLRAANPAVRRNALELLVDAFPLRVRKQGKEWKRQEEGGTGEQRPSPAAMGSREEELRTQ